MGKRLDLNIKFNRPQLEAHKVIAPRTTVFTGWGRGVGKSYFPRQQSYMRIAAWEHKQRPGCTEKLTGCRVLGLMPTLKQFKDVHMDGLQRELGKGGKWEFLGAKINANLGTVEFPGGSWIRPFPATAHNSKSARGQRGDIILGDEIDDVDPEVYHSIAIPWLSEPFSLAIELLGGTPTRGRHGLWWQMLEAGRAAQRLRDGTITPEQALTEPFAQEIIEVFSALEPQHIPPGFPEDPELCALQILRSFYGFHATYKDAPETVSPLAVAKAKRTTPKATFEREWMANPDAGEGLVYPFNDDFHVREPDPGTVWSEMLIGCDHGWEDPGVLLLIGVLGNGNDATCHVLEEVYAQHMSRDWWLEKGRKWFMAYPNHRFYGDPSQPEFLNAYKKSGARLVPADNSIEDGVPTVANKLVIRSVDLDQHGENTREFAQLYVSPRCQNTIREFGLYRRRKRSDGSFQDAPEDRNNHAMDALRYAIFNRFGPAGPSRRNFNRYDQR